MLKKALVATLLFNIHANAELIDGVQAVVNNAPILNSDVQKRLSALNSSETLANILGIKNEKRFTAQQVLDLLINEKIILEYAKSLNSSPTDSEINAQVSAIAKQNNLSLQQLRDSLKSEKIDFNIYKETMKVQLAKRAIVEKELRSSATGQSDQELRAFYDKNVGQELNISLIAFGTSKAQRSSLSSLKTTINKTPTKAAEFIKNKSPVDLGWTAPSALNSKFSSAIEKSNQTAIGPISLEGKNFLLVVLGKRQGSEELFQKSKEQIRQQLQSKEVDERFELWLVQQKKRANVVVNES